MTRDGTEAMHEADALEWIGDWWVPVTGEAIAPGSGERETWEDLAIPGRLLDALRRLNPGVPNEQLVQAREEILTPSSADAITERGFHIVFRTWGDTRVARIRADWTALGSVRSEDDWQLY